MSATGMARKRAMYGASTSWAMFSPSIQYIT